MAVVHERYKSVLCTVFKAELGRADGVGFDSDAEDLGFKRHGDEIAVIAGTENAVERFGKAAARSLTVGGGVLVAVGYPDVHEALFAGLAGEIFRDAQAGYSVADPEFAHVVVGA